MKYGGNVVSTDKQDKRNCPRTENDYDVLIYKADLKIKAHSKNLSENGMYLTTDGLLFPKDSQVKLVYIDESTKNHVVYGKVVRRNMHGIGVSLKMKS